MGDTPDNEEPQFASTVHLCPSGKQKMDQMQWPRIRSNKVGVDEGVTNIDVGKDEEERGSRSPAGRTLSAKLRASSGLSQFREVDFSDQVQGSADKGKTKQYVVPDSLRGSDVFSAKADDDGETGADAGADAGVDAGKCPQGDLEHSGKDLADVGSQVADEKGAKEQALHEEVTKNDQGITLVKEAVTEGEGEGECREKQNGAGGETDGKPADTDAVNTVHGKGGAFAYGVVASQIRYNPWRESRVPSSLRLREYEEGASTSKMVPSHAVASTSSVTDDTELSLEEEISKPRRPLHQQDDKAKPVLTPTSIAIYSTIQKNGTSSGTCVLFTMAGCTFIVTIVLTIALLVASRSSWIKKEDPADRSVPAIITSSNNTSGGTSRSALRAYTVARILKVLLTTTPSPTPDTPAPTSSIASTSSTTPPSSIASTTPPGSQDSTQPSKDAITTRSP
ncbi:uncharacterized protein [Procambarus clarkii]|uniref:uncharacterized protein n=1 Tax=Procambarus clarkii TaxID=6728 RepID=UPI00374386A6